MIRVTRRKGSEPELLRSPVAERARRELARFFRRSKARRAQERAPFDGGLYASPEVMDALRRLFHGKCAYCESRATLIEVDHFRPRIRAMGLDGTVDADHYWWLAYAWENLLPACTECNRSKGSRFPVGRARAEAHATGPALRSERALLIDPCADRPEQELVFTEDGLVVSDTERGRATIDILALNREALVAGRKLAAAELRARFEAGATGPEDADAEQQYAALRRQLLAAWGAETGLRKVKGGPLLGEVERRETAERFQDHMTKQQVYSVEAQAPEDVEAYYAGAKRIEWVELTNFKAIRKLEVTLPTPPSERESWLMLLGENGTGKSSILQAVALALMGEEHAAELGLDASAFVRRGARVGRASVKLTSVPEAVTVEFRRGSPVFRHLTPGPKALLQAYGATRLLRRGTIAPTRSVQAQNLFDPTAPLADVVGWLGDEEQVPPARFDAVALALKDLLMLDPEDRFDREDGRIEATVYGETVPLEQLSDGFQSVISLCGNIMMGLFERWEAVEDAEAIVLVDELEAHLHPTWKIEIVNRLRRTFPRVAFIASTHDPLALKGLEEGEIAVMRRDERRQIVIETDVPSVNDLRADQILTSFLFGLHSTRGDAATQSISRYAELMSKSRRTEAEEQELLELRGRLQQTMTSAETPVQRAVEQALSQALLEAELPAVAASVHKESPTAEELELRRQVAQLVSPAESA